MDMNGNWCLELWCIQSHSHERKMPSVRAQPVFLCGRCQVSVLGTNKIGQLGLWGYEVWIHIEHWTRVWCSPWE